MYGILVRFLHCASSIYFVFLMAFSHSVVTLNKFWIYGVNDNVHACMYVLYDVTCSKLPVYTLSHSFGIRSYFSDI